MASWPLPLTPRGLMIDDLCHDEDESDVRTLTRQAPLGEFTGAQAGGAALSEALTILMGAVPPVER